MSCFAHGFADREQRLFQADQEQRQTHQHIDESADDPARVRQATAQHRELEKDENGDYGRDIESRGQRRAAKCLQEFEHHTTMP